MTRSILFSQFARLAVTAGGLGWLFAHADISAILNTIPSVPVLAFIASGFWISLALLAATARWRVLMCDVIPNVRVKGGYLLKLTLTSVFFATLLPGAIAGDAARAYAVRREADGLAPSIGIVATERVLSVAALLGVTGLLTLKTESLPAGWAWGLALGGGIILPLMTPLLIFLAQTKLPSARLPTFSWQALAAALAWSVLGQTATALALFCVVSALWPQTPTWPGLAAALLTQITGFLPAIAGLGPSQAMGTYLLTRIGVPIDIAATSTLALWMVGMLFVAAGGAIYLWNGFTSQKVR